MDIPRYYRGRCPSGSLGYHLLRAAPRPENRQGGRSKSTRRQSKYGAPSNKGENSPQQKPPGTNRPQPLKLSAETPIPMKESFMWRSPSFYDDADMAGVGGARKGKEGAPYLLAESSKDRGVENAAEARKVASMTRRSESEDNDKANQEAKHNKHIKGLKIKSSIHMRVVCTVQRFHNCKCSQSEFSRIVLAHFLYK